MRLPTTSTSIARSSAQPSCCTAALHVGAQPITATSSTAAPWQQPLVDQAIARGLPPLPPAVALGKFDALHRGHQALAAACGAQNMQPWMVSFSGMAQVLGWPQRLPLVAPQDRANVLSTWAPLCHNQTPQELYIPFKEVRSLSPRAFVDLLAQTLHVRRVVVGENYRFGYRAAGDTRVLQEECARFDIEVKVLQLVEQQQQDDGDGGDGDGDGGSSGGTVDDGGAGVSSSRVREMLAVGCMQEVETMLGRPYRLVSVLMHNQLPQLIHNHPNGACPPLSVPLSSLCNQPPGAGVYTASLQVAPMSDMDARACATAACEDQPADGSGEPVHLAQQLVELQVAQDGTVLLPLEVGALQDLARTGEMEARGVQLELTFC